MTRSNFLAKRLLQTAQGYVLSATDNLLLTGWLVFVDKLVGGLWGVPLACALSCESRVFEVSVGTRRAGFHDEGFGV